MSKSNPIWRVYTFTTVISVIATVVMVFVRWEDIKREARTDLIYTNSIVTRSIQSVLNKNEVLLKILGERMVELGNIQNSDKAIELINGILLNNPELAGIGLADPSGQLLITSFNIDRNKLPNLLNNPNTADSFKKALISDGMVMGRTYFMKAMNKWVIPLRYRITDNSGKVIVVMTTGLKLDYEKNLWSTSYLQEDVQLLVYKDDFFRQYVSNINLKDYSYWYKSPLSKERYNLFVKSLEEHTGLSLNDLKLSGGVTSLILPDHVGNDFLQVFNYDPVYGHYTFVNLPLKVLYLRMMTPVGWLLGLLLVFNIALYRIFQSNIRLHDKTKRRLKYQATHDLLTSLPNRRYLIDVFSGWQKKFNNNFCVMFIDLNNFKACNDIHGHSIGDAILKVVAHRINEIFANCLNIHQSGDEFIILMPLESVEDVKPRCIEFINKLDEPIHVGELEFSLSANIGIVHAPEHGTEIEQLLRKADMAMFEAKRLQTNLYTYSSGLEEQRERIVLIETELSNALERNEFYLAYQPQLDANSYKVIGVEALLRWESPVLGFVPPDEFIPIAESTGDIHKIGQYVFETAIKEIHDICQSIGEQVVHKKPTDEKFRLSINVSVKQILRDGFMQKMSILKKSPECTELALMLEVTESLFIDEVKKAQLVLNEVQKEDISISLDDFGTGYSSLSILSKLPIQELKIDKSFINDILINQQAKSMIQSIISIGKKLKIPVLAEGVEDIKQAELLTFFGCDVFQGYYFAKPMTKAALIEYLLHD